MAKQDMTMPPMTEQEQYFVRMYIALSHQEGKCHIYTDDGEIQCSNMVRHGRCIDFRRESITNIMDTLEETKMKELISGAEREEDPNEPGVILLKLNGIVIGTLNKKNIG